MQRFERDLAARLEAMRVRHCALVLGVSGGADSMALLRGVAAARDALALQVAAVYVDHGLRPESHEDAAWVREQCRRLGVPCEVRRIDVAAESARARTGLEETARKLRYDCLRRAAIDSTCETVAVAHTADDQAETVLHHLIRGTGLDGLRGMPAERDLGEGVRLVRPLLDVTRATIHSYLTAAGQSFREDATNSDAAFTRNRIRHRLLPLLRDEFNPQVAAAVLRLSGQATELQTVAAALSSRLLAESMIECQPTLVRLDCGALTSQPRALVREVFKQLWDRQGWPRGGMSFDHWDRLAGLAVTAAPVAVSLPGGVAARRRDGLLMLHRR